MPLFTNRKTNQKVSCLLTVVELDTSKFKNEKDVENFKNLSDDETRQWLVDNTTDVKIFHSMKHLKSVYADQGKTPWQVVFGRSAGVWVYLLGIAAAVMSGVAFGVGMWAFGYSMLLVSIYGFICAVNIHLRIKRDEKFWQFEEVTRKALNRIKREEDKKKEVKKSGKRSTNKATKRK